MPFGHEAAHLRLYSTHRNGKFINPMKKDLRYHVLNLFVKGKKSKPNV